MRRLRRLATALAVALVAVIAVSFAAQRADARAASISCWADPGNPAHVGSNVVVTVTWQCSPGTPQQIQMRALLTSPSGTVTQGTNTCLNSTYCQVTISVPWTSTSPYTWTSKADWAYVVDGGGSSSYFTGGSNTVYLP